MRGEARALPLDRKLRNFLDDFRRRFPSHSRFRQRAQTVDAGMSQYFSDFLLSPGAGSGFGDSQPPHQPTTLALY